MAISTERRPRRIANPPIMPPMNAPGEDGEDCDEFEVRGRKNDDKLPEVESVIDMSDDKL